MCVQRTFPGKSLFSDNHYENIQNPIIKTDVSSAACVERTAARAGYTSNYQRHLKEIERTAVFIENGDKGFDGNPAWSNCHVPKLQ